MIPLTSKNFITDWFSAIKETPTLANPTATALVMAFVDEAIQRKSFVIQIDWKDIALAVGFANYRTFENALDHLLAHGIIRQLSERKNQHTRLLLEIVAFAENTKATQKQVQSDAKASTKRVESDEKAPDLVSHTYERAHAPLDVVNSNLVTTDKEEIVTEGKGVGKPKSNRKAKPQPTALDFPVWADEGFMARWERLIQLPKWRDKPNSARQISLTRLGKFDLEFANLLLDEALEAGIWTGVVFPESPARYEEWKKKKALTDTAPKPQEAQSMRDLVLSEKSPEELTHDERMIRYPAYAKQWNAKHQAAA